MSHVMHILNKLSNIYIYFHKKEYKRFCVYTQKILKISFAKLRIVKYQTDFVLQLSLKLQLQLQNWQVGVKSINLTGWAQPQ